MWNDSEFNSTFSSPGGGSKEVKRNLIKHIVPVTAQIISQCQQVENENSVFEYSNMRFHQVCFIGLIRSVIKKATDITYMVDDMTSEEISVRLQNDDDGDMETEDAPKKEQVQFIENQYVKVFGIIKFLQGQKNVQAFRIMPIKELNEVTHHMLDCMSAMIYYTQKEGGGGSGFGSESTSHNPLKNANLNGGSGYQDNSSNMSGLSGLHQAVNSFVKQAKTSEGWHLSEIIKYFKGHSEGKIKEAIEFLSNEGHIYSTIDDEHFKTTDATEN